MLTGGGGRDTFVYTGADATLQIGGAAGTIGSVTGFGLITDFAPGATAATSELLGFSARSIGSSLTTNDSTLVLHTGAVIRSHTISNGIVTFNDISGSQSLSTLGDVAAATQYLSFNDWGSAGATLAFTATISGVTHTFVYTQTTSLPGITNAAMVDLVNVSATSIVTNGTTLSVLDQIAPNAPSITSIPENGGGGINAAEAPDGTPVVVSLSGTGAISNDTLTINWGGQAVNYTLLAGDILAGSATVTVPAGTITAQGQGTFNVTARLTDAVGNASANSSATPVTVDTVAPTAPSITSIPENGGGGINAAEASNGTPVVVGLTGTGAAAGDTLTVHWGSQTVTYTLLAADISGNSATVTVPAGDDHGAGPGHVQRDGRADRCGGQCRRQLDGDPGNGRHGGADGAVDHRDPGEWRRHQCRRGLERHAGGGGPCGHRGGGGRHAQHPLGRPDGHLHAPGGRHLGQQRDGDGAGRRRSRRRARARST